MSHRLAKGLVLSVAVFAGQSIAQPANHIGEPLAKVFVSVGCVMSEEQAVAGLKRAGFGAGDFQAQVMALHRGGYVVPSGDGRLKLVKWEPCR